MHRAISKHSGRPPGFERAALKRVGHACRDGPEHRPKPALLKPKPRAVQPAKRRSVTSAALSMKRPQPAAAGACQHKKGTRLGLPGACHAPGVRRRTTWRPADSKGGRLRKAGAARSAAKSARCAQRSSLCATEGTAATAPRAPPTACSRRRSFHSQPKQLAQPPNRNLRPPHSSRQPAMHAAGARGRRSTPAAV